MAAKTLEELRTLAADRAAITVTSTGRHTSEQLTALVNASLEEYHVILTDAGMPQRATQATVTTSSSTTVANGYPTNERVVLPTDFGQLLEVFVEYSGVRMPLRPFSGLDASLDAGWIVAPTGVPERYQLAREATDGETVMRLLPACSGAYDITVTYIPTFTELVEDLDEFQFIDGTLEFVVCDVAMKLLENDGIQEGAQYQALAHRRDQSGERLRRHAMRMNRAGPQAMIDVRRRTRRSTGGYFA